jgi:hypothetical protein
MIVERIERPNTQPLVQESKAKLLKRQAANEPDPNLYGINANQGRGNRKAIDGGGIVRAVYWSLCVWAIVVTAILVIGRA